MTFQQETPMDNRYEKIYACWQEFVATGKIQDDSPVRQIILESWKRSREFGLDPYACKRLFKDLKVLREENRELIEVALPYMELVQSFVAGSGFVLILIDGEGYILQSIGDPEVIKKASQNNLAPGENRSEKVTGTNAISLTLASGKPIQIFGPEHYSENFHNWTCSSSPIKNSAGEIVGALNLSGHYSLLHKHTLGMVVSAVKAIERELTLVEAHREALEANKFLEAVVDSVSDGLLAAALDGNIIKMNSRVVEFLGSKVSHLRDVITPGSLLDDMIQKGCDFTEREHYFPKKRSYGLITARTIKGTRDEAIGFLMTIKEKQKVHSLIHRMVGATASFSFKDIIGQSTAINECINLAETAAETDCKVLLEGESGTGKELFAQSIHNASKRKKGPFIAVNCSAIPRELIESELFGYEEGAFSGANKKGKPGRFELAEGGTLFLDEASSMSLDMQAKLLRVLQENSIMRLGGVNFIPLNVRLIVATNKDLTDLIKEGSFRQDLYYRLSVFTLRIPSLRERKEDIPLLVEHFCRKSEQLLTGNPIKVSPEVIQALKAYHWPGNIRELENVLERAIILSKGFLESVSFLPETFKKTGKSGTNAALELEFVKENAIRDALNKTNGNITQAAKILGISRNTIYNKIKKSLN